MNVSKKLLQIREFKIFRLRTLIVLTVIALAIFCSVVAWRLAVVANADRILNQIIFRVSPKSVVRVEIDQSDASTSAELKFDFDIIDRDRVAYDKLAARLKLGDSFPKEIRVGVTDSTKEWLKELLPLEIKLTLSNQRLSFGNVSLQGLVSSQAKSEYHFASNSGSLDLQMTDAKDVDLAINDLKTVIDEASKSGELYVSPVFRDMNGLIEGVKNVRLQIKGRRVDGWVVFDSQ